MCVLIKLSLARSSAPNTHYYSTTIVHRCRCLVQPPTNCQLGDDGIVTVFDNLDRLINNRPTSHTTANNYPIISSICRWSMHFCQILTLPDWLIPKCSVEYLEFGLDGLRFRVVPDVDHILLGRHRVRNRTAKVLYPVRK